MSVLGTFILAILLHPEVQGKAQAELDRIIGKDRLPTHDDEPDLPYITAVYRETLRYIVSYCRPCVSIFTDTLSTDGVKSHL